MTIDVGPARGFEGSVHIHSYKIERCKYLWKRSEFIVESKTLFLETDVTRTQVVSTLSSSRASAGTKPFICYVSTADTGGGGVGLIYGETELLTLYFNLFPRPQ